MEDAVLARIDAACAHPIRVPRRTEVFAEGDPEDDIHVLMDGWACRERILTHDRRLYPAIFLPGDVCDLDRLSSRRLDFGLVTLTPATIVRLPVDEVESMARQSPALRRAMRRLTSAENAVMTENAVSLGRRSARERLAHLLCELACRLSGSADVSPSFEAPITQENWADLTGLSAVHLNRSLQALRTDELLQVSGRTIRILDWPGLMRAGLFTPDYLHLDDHRAAEAARAAPGTVAGNGEGLRSGAAESTTAGAAGELNHRVANSLQLASSFLAQQQRRTRDEAARSALSDARTRLDAVGRLHRYLYVHGRNRQVDLRTFLAGVCSAIAEGTGLACHARAPSVAIDGSAAQQLGILVNEVALNAAKHAFPGRRPGRLSVEADLIGRQLRLRLSDDGRGLPRDFDIGADHGLGMTILSAVARQLGGALRAANHGGGAQFTLLAPLDRLQRGSLVL
ncbi:MULTISPECIES: sensor histidine kinase [unclassified Phenylobacterium]|uniref:sensor histidine kinase n=1 Tax=unclassified Phenylobacterium TaxID=2640670 RepID=UPI001E5E4D50|nr:MULTISPECIES: histidine kinase dimerization/phosphoacceptor domain -containing protein [unclassified Phenylobacterium]